MSNLIKTGFWCRLAHVQLILWHYSDANVFSLLNLSRKCFVARFVSSCFWQFKSPRVSRKFPDPVTESPSWQHWRNCMFLGQVFSFIIQHSLIFRPKYRNWILHCVTDKQLSLLKLKLSFCMLWFFVCWTVFFLSCKHQIL